MDGSPIDHQSHLERNIMKIYYRFYLTAIILLAGISANVLLAKAADPPEGGNDREKVVALENYDKLHAGEGAGNRTVVPTNQMLSPLGEQLSFSSRPTAVAISGDQRRLGVLAHNRVLLIDLETNQVTGEAAISGSFTGIVFSRGGKELFASNIKGSVEEFSVSDDGILKETRSFRLVPPSKDKSTDPAPAGLALDPGGKRLWAVFNRQNSVAEIDLTEGRIVREIPVGNAPYDVACANGKLYVSNWAGRLPTSGDATGPSGNAAPVRVDAKQNIASEGSVSVVDPVQGKAIKELVAGPHTSGLAVSPDGRYVCAANANADTV
jgi:DNA-binding beta-propeller fold protein YncE